VSGVKVRDVPLMLAVRDAVAPLLPLLLDGFEAGVDYARLQADHFRTTFDKQRLTYDPWFFPHCVRIYVKEHLTRHGYRVEDYQVDNLAFSGLRFVSEEWDMRTRKSVRQGEMPRLSTSAPVQAHCQSMLPGDFALVPQRKLWLLWHISPPCEFTGLSVVYLLDENSTQPKSIGQLDFPATSPLFRSPAERERDLEAVGDLDMEMLPLGGELDMELVDDLGGVVDGSATTEQAE
jgi:hypothetical protein